MELPFLPKIDTDQFPQRDREGPEMQIGLIGKNDNFRPSGLI